MDGGRWTAMVCRRTSVVSSWQPDGVFHFGDGLFGNRAGALRAVFEHFPHVLRVAGQLGPPGAERLEVQVDVLGQDLLAVYTADAGPPALGVDHGQLVWREGL